MTWVQATGTAYLKTPGAQSETRYVKLDTYGTSFYATYG